MENPKGIFDMNTTYIFLIFVMIVMFILKSRFDDKRQTESRIRNVYKSTLQEQRDMGRAELLAFESMNVSHNYTIGPQPPINTRI